MSLKGHRILVTGAGGFIGSHLTEALARTGARVRAMLHYSSRPDRGNLEHADPATVANVEILRGDVTDAHFVESAVDGCDVVLHLAALIAIPHSYTSPGSYVQTNVVGTLNVMQACRRSSVSRIVHTSTSECYGTADYAPIDEAHPLKAQSPYAATKIAADKLVESFHLSFGLPVVTLRPFNTFGPRQSARAVIPAIVSQLVSGCDELRLGSLAPERDFNFVGNTVDAFLAAIEAEAAVGQLVNVGSGSKISIGELARLSMEATGRNVPIRVEHERVRPDKSEVGLLLCDRSFAERTLGWTPRVDFRSGLAQTVEFIRANLAAFRPREYMR